MSGLASLPMYDVPRSARDAFWDALRSRLIAAGVAGVPDRLVEPTDLEAHWRSPDLLFSQTCGAPFATTLENDLIPLGVPHYRADDCEGPLYRSLFVVRADDPARRLADLPGRRPAINGFGSHSGFSQLATALEPFALGRPVAVEPFVTGSHLGSLQAVRSGNADFAAIDCVTWALAARDQPEEVGGLMIIGRSQPSLGLPFITSRRNGLSVANAIRRALHAVMREPALACVCDALMLANVSPVTSDAYRAHSEDARRAESLWRDRTSAGEVVSEEIL